MTQDLCGCCGMSLAEIDATIDSAVRRILPFSVSLWRTWAADCGFLAIDIARVAHAEAHLIRSEFRSILEAKEHIAC